MEWIFKDYFIMQNEWIFYSFLISMILLIIIAFLFVAKEIKKSKEVNISKE